MALTLAHYLEDVISDFGLWAAFTSKHRELYGKYLPFYTIDEENYYCDEINPEDVRFLIWMVLQKSKETTFCNPENPYLCPGCRQNLRRNGKAVRKSSYQ